jgi:hypothetical protein
MLKKGQKASKYNFQSKYNSQTDLQCCHTLASVDTETQFPDSRSILPSLIL